MIILPKHSVCCMHSKDGCHSHATYRCVTLDSLARCLLAVAGAATPISKSRVQSVCGQGRSAPNKTLSRCMMAPCPLYQSVTTEVCHCAGTWVHCSSLALPAKVFILTHFHAIVLAACQLIWQHSVQQTIAEQCDQLQGCSMPRSMIYNVSPVS